MEAIKHLAKSLSSNLPVEREKGLRKLAKWLKTVSTSKNVLAILTEEWLMKLWKGIFYYFWHCDKMLVQEDRAEKIANLIHNIQNEELLLSFIDTFFKAMCKEWPGIDRYRLEKFMMLVRRFLHEAFVHLKKVQWQSANVQALLNVLKNTVVGSDSAPFGLRNHISEIYLEELARTGSDDLSAEAVEEFLKPFYEILCESTNDMYLRTIKKDVFFYLLNQDADTMEHHDFPVLKFDAEQIKSNLLSHCETPNLKRKNMKLIHSIVKRYQDFCDGVSVEAKLFEEKKPTHKLSKRDIVKATEDLMKEHEEILEEKRQTKKQRRMRQCIDL